MPLVPDELVPLRVGRASYVRPPEQEALGLADTVGAAGTVANWSYRSWRYADNRDGVDFDPEHDPLSMIRGTPYETDPARFAFSRNEQETRAIMAEWDEDEAAMETLARSGWTGTVAAVGMGLLDPTIFIPVVGVAGGIARGSRAAKIGLDVAAASGVGAAIGETAMAVTTPGYGPGDAALGIGSATILGGLLGAGAGALLSRGERKAMAKVLDAERAEISAEIAATARPAAPRPAAAGAAASDERQLEMRNLSIANYTPDITAKVSPTRRVMNSPFVEARRAVADLAEMPYLFKQNDKGIATTQGPALDRLARMEVDRARVALLDRYKDAYTRYRFGGAPETWRQSAGNAATRALDVARAPAGGKVDFKTFDAMVDEALRGGDQHAIPEVAELAKIVRDTVIVPWRDRAIKAGLLPEDVGVETAASYMMRVWNKQKLVGERPRAVQVFADWLEGEEGKKVALQGSIGDLKGKLDANAAELEKLRLKLNERLGANADTHRARMGQLEAENAALRTRLEEQIAAWEGKSAKEAKAALASREAQGPRQDGARREGADGAIDAAVKRILAKERLRDRQEIESVANEIVDRIVGNPDGRLPYDAHTAPRAPGPAGEARGPLAARDFMIPDALVRDFIETSALNTSQIYMRTMVPDVLLTERFGDVNMTESLRKLKDEHAAMANAAKTPAEREKLNSQYQRTVADLAGMRDRMRGTYGYTSDPRGKMMARVAQSVANYDVQTNLGLAGFAALIDMAGVQWHAGLMNTFRNAWAPFVKALYSPETRRAVMAHRKQLRAAGIAAEAVLSQRMTSLNDITELYRPTTRMERGLGFMAEKMNLVNGMAYVTDFGKLAAGMVSSAEFIGGVRAVTAGKAKPGQVRKLAENGIDAAMARRIAAALDGEGAAETIDGIVVPNTQAWADRGAAEAFEGAIARQSNIMILTPGAEKPLSMSNPIWALILQYKSIVVAANERLLVRSLQTRDAAVISGLVSALALGVMVDAIYAWFNDRELPAKPADLVKAGLIRSGVLGWYQEANAVSEKVFGLDGFKAIGATQRDARYINREQWTAWLGPTAGKLESLFAIGSDVAKLEWTEHDTRRLRRLLPFQNLHATRLIFDKLGGD
jgi:hypothetical protein